MFWLRNKNLFIFCYAFSTKGPVYYVLKFRKLFSHSSIISVGNHEMLFRIANKEEPGQIAQQSDWVLLVCLGLFDRQLVFRFIVEQCLLKKTSI